MKFSVSSSLRSKRKMAGLTQGQLATLSGISRNAYANIERGVNLVALDHALMIARVLGCHVEDIWSIDDDLLDQESVSPCDICYRPVCVGCSLGFKGVFIND